MVLTINNLYDKIIIVAIFHCKSDIYKHNSGIVHERQTLITIAQNSTEICKNKDYFAIIFLLNFKFKII